MALINCPNCGNTISNKALKCPHCGEELHIEAHPEQELQPQQYYPASGKSNNTLLYLIIGILASIIVIGGFILIGFKYYNEVIKAKQELIQVPSLVQDTTAVVYASESECVLAAQAAKTTEENVSQKTESDVQQPIQQKREEYTYTPQVESEYMSEDSFPEDAFTCIIDGPANVRELPNTKSAVMGSIRNGMMATVSHVSGNMYQIHQVVSTDGRKEYSGKVIGYYTHRQNIVIR